MTTDSNTAPLARISYMDICRDEAEACRDSYKFGGVPFDPTDPEYDDDARRMFALADAFDSLATLIEVCEQIDGSGDLDTPLELVHQLAAGFPVPSPVVPAPAGEQR
jgi:hypothetical protein